MTMPDSKIRFFALASLLLALCLTAPLYATEKKELELNAYTAIYNVKGRGMSLGTAEISLQPFEGMWRWSMTTEANAFVTIFTNDKPFSETTLTWDGNELRLQKIHIADENDKKHVETASFNWEGGQMDVLRKQKERQVELADDVYDLQSIHLRSAIMQANQEKEASFLLYYKGKLLESQLLYQGNQSIQVGDRKIDAQVFEHSITNTDKALKYYYEAARPLMPVLIENLKSGKNHSELGLKSAK